MENWYVIQVRSGMEERTRKSCELLIPREILTACFIPYVSRMKKNKTQWKTVNEVLFKGYVFLISDSVKDLYQELKKVPELTKLLGKQNEDIYPLKIHEIEFLKSFKNDKGIIDMSTGYIEGEKIIVTNGPLQGKEGLIKRIDRHKRIAYLELDFFGKTTVAKVGLEIISKSI